MPKAAFGSVLQFLHRISAAHGARDLSDAELLQRFKAEGEAAALSILVQRHGPMVLAVCRRILGDWHTADDAFQATFIVLVRRARSLRCTGSLGSWLFAVARRIAIKARSTAARRQSRERKLGDMAQREQLDEVTWKDLRAVLDEEIGRLPEKYREPVVLCYFESKSYDQAAKELGWSKSTLAKRLTRARELLRQQLVKRGITLSAAALATALCEKVSGAPVAAMLTINTVKAAMSATAGKAAGGGCVSVAAVAMAEVALRSMLGVKAVVICMVLALGVTVSGAGLAGMNWAPAAKPAGKSGKPAAMAVQMPEFQPLKTTPLKLNPRVDLFGDPLPDGAAARLGTMRFRHANVGEVAYSTDGTILASIGSYSYGVCLLDATTGRLLHRVAFPPEGSSLAFSPGGKTLFIGASQGELTLIDVVTGKELRQFGKIGNNFPRVAFAPDGKVVAVSQRVQDGSKVTLFDVANGQKQRTLEWVCETEPNYYVSPAVAFSPDGKILATGSPDKTVRLWEVTTGKELRALAGHEKEVLWIAFSKDGKCLVSSGYSGAIRVWDAKTGKLLWSFRDDQGTARECAFSPDGKALAAAFDDGTLRLFDPETGKELRNRKANVRFWSLAFSPDGKVLACPSGSAIHLFDAGTLKEIGPITGHTDRVANLRFKADGQALFSVGRDRQFLEWDLATLQKHRALFTDVSGTAELLSGKVRYPWNAVDISPSGKVVALVRRLYPGNKAEDAVRLYDCETGQELFALRGHNEWADFVLFSPDGNVLASAGKDGIRLWDVATGNQQHYLQEQLSFNRALAFSNDGKQLIFANPDGTIQLLEVAAAKEKHRLPSGQKYTRALAFSPDGKLVAAVSDTVVQVWDAESGKKLLRFGVLVRPSSVAFSPTGRILAVGEWEEYYKKGDRASTGRVTMWEVISGQELRRIDMQQGVDCSLAFSPDGRTLATGGADSTILLWDLTGQSTAGQQRSAPPTAIELDALWTELAGDAVKADTALWALALNPKQSMPLLQERLRPPPPAAAAQVAKLIADLESERFTTRQEATKALSELGAAAEAHLRKTLENNLTLEVRQRIELILDKRNRDTVRNLRAIEALEQIGTPEARQVLQILATDSPTPRVMQGAAAALERVAKRQR